MSDISPFNEQMRSIRRQTLAVLDDVAKAGKAYKLPDPPASLEEYRLKVLDNTYKVLVVGEMKRGKSSFVNALIGRDILPTDVDISTCEVFRVRRALQEGYRIRFEDGSAKEITAADLKKYGSQGVRDIQGMPQLAQIIRWIEVDLPTAQFLPVGVNLLDTPGLGSLYAAHGQITQRFVPQADAVIFITDADKPLIESELEFVKKILEVTCNIFFVLTKIDKYNNEKWQENQQRDEALLKERFKNRLSEVHIWPFSSKNLIQAAATGDEDYLEVSYYKQLSAALQTFLFRVAGWNRCVEAVLAANYYHIDSKKILLGRLVGLQAPSKQKLYELRQQATERKQQFDAEWGASGKKSRELVLSIQNTATSHKRNFEAFLTVNGQLETTYRQKIQAVKSPEEAKKLSDTIDDAVVTEVLNTWRTTGEQAYRECAALLAPFIDAAHQLLYPPEIDQPELTVPRKSAAELESNLLSKIQIAQTNLGSGIKITANAVQTIGKIVAAFSAQAALPVYIVGLPAILAVGIWSAFRGWSGVQKKQVQGAQNELQEHLTDLVREVRLRFLQADVAGGLSPVNHYFSILVEMMNRQIQEIAQEKSGQTQAEASRLDEEIRLDEQQRKEKAEQVQQQLNAWDGIGRSIEALVADLKVLDLSL